MSRLKGSDLGVSVPGAAVNYRGDWTASPNPAYAINDLVLRSGIPYLAIDVPGATDPAVPPGSSGNTSISSTNYSQRNGGQRAFTQVFTPSGNTVLDTIFVAAQTANGLTGTLKIGIVAGAVTSGNVATSTFLCSGTAPGSSFAFAGVQVGVAMDKKIQLVAGQTYTVVVYETTGTGDIGKIRQTSGGTISNPGITTVGTQYYATGGTTITGAEAANVFLVFSLMYSGQVWKSLTPAVLSDASSNTKIGTNALAALTTGSTSTAVGTNALQSATTAASNVGVGYGALSAITTGGNNVAVGYQAMSSTGAAPTQNVAVGYQALQATTGNSNVAVGHTALKTNTSGGSNVAVGLQAGFSNTTGVSNTYVGTSAGQTNVTGAGNTAVGTNALFATTVGGGTAVGQNALSQSTTGLNNTAVGNFACNALTTGGNNTSLGANAGKGPTTTSDNTALGYNTLTGATFGDCTAVGSQALKVTTGQYQTAVGSQALLAATNSINNTAVGYQAGVALTTGGQNVLIGAPVAAALTTGSFNVVIGNTAAVPAAGASHTIVGMGASTNAASNATVLGKNAAANAVGATAIGIDSAGTAALTTTQDEMKLGTVLTSVYCGKDVRTSDPGTGAGYWKLGSPHAGAVALDTANYVEVAINGVVKKLALVN